MTPVNHASRREGIHKLFSMYQKILHVVCGKNALGKNAICKNVRGNNAIDKNARDKNYLYKFSSLFVSHVTQYDSIMGKGETMQQEYNVCALTPIFLPNFDFIYHYIFCTFIQACHQK